jgi:hypothetical protein
MAESGRDFDFRAGLLFCRSPVSYRDSWVFSPSLSSRARRGCPDSSCGCGAIPVNLVIVSATYRVESVTARDEAGM